jgi:hypothetical protein
MRALDAFLVAADKGTYDPDAFLTALSKLRASDRIYDAAALLTRHKRDGHCSPAIIAAARELARAPYLGPAMRSDLYGTAVNCSLPSVRADVLDDLEALDKETWKLPDPTRSLSVLLFTTELSLRQGRWEPALRLASAPDFVSRWMNVSPTAASAALLINHAVVTLSGAEVDAARTAGAYQLLCETFPAGDRDRASMCVEARNLRPPFKTSIEARQKLARESLEKLVKQAAAPPPGVPGAPPSP